MRTKPTILLTGSTGQVGFELIRSLTGIGRVVAPKRAEMDLSNLDSIRSIVRHVKPDIIINPAAYTAVDQAESEQASVMRINGEAPGVLAEEAALLSVPLVHMSTNYVFEGTKLSAYIETDPASPLNVYGVTKLAGERAVEKVGGQHLILRTGWVYGRRGRNFLLTILRLAEEQEHVSVVDDQFGTPTWSRTVANLIAEVVQQSFAAPYKNDWWRRYSGIYHLSATGSSTWAQFAREILVIARSDRSNIIRAVKSSEFPTAAIRPLNSRLSTQQFESTFGVHCPDWREALLECLGAER